MERRAPPSSPLDILSDVAMSKNNSHAKSDMQATVGQENRSPSVAPQHPSLQQASSAPRPNSYDPHCYSRFAYGYSTPFYYHDPCAASHHQQVADTQHPMTPHGNVAYSAGQPGHIVPTQELQKHYPQQQAQQHMQQYPGLSYVYPPYALPCQGFVHPMSPPSLFSFPYSHLPMSQTPPMAMSSMISPSPHHYPYGTHCPQPHYAPPPPPPSSHYTLPANLATPESMCVNPTTNGSNSFTPLAPNQNVPTLQNHEIEVREDKDALSSTQEKAICRTLRAGRRDSYTRFTAEEESLLVDGVRQFGVGNWKQILAANPKFHWKRTPVDLKDKWRNLTRARQRRTATMSASITCGEGESEPDNEEPSAEQEEEEEEEEVGNALKAHAITFADGNGKSASAAALSEIVVGENEIAKAVIESRNRSTSEEQDSKQFSSSLNQVSDANTVTACSGSDVTRSRSGSNNSSSAERSLSQLI